MHDPICRQSLPSSRLSRRTPNLVDGEASSDTTTTAATAVKMPPKEERASRPARRSSRRDLDDPAVTPHGSEASAATPWPAGARSAQGNAPAATSSRPIRIHPSQSCSTAACGRNEVQDMISRHPRLTPCGADGANWHHPPGSVGRAEPECRPIGNRTARKRWSRTDRPSSSPARDATLPCRRAALVRTGRLRRPAADLTLEGIGPSRGVDIPARQRPLTGPLWAGETLGSARRSSHAT